MASSLTSFLSIDGWASKSKSPNRNVDASEAKRSRLARLRASMAVTSTSKGKGFQGVVKRHGFAGGAATHGSMFHRAPGSIGASSYPSRVVPGMRMGGHMGNAQTTVRNLEVIEVDTEDNVLIVKGAVPGPNGGYVLVRRSKR